MKDKRLDEFKKAFGLEEIPSKLEQNINVKQRTKLHIKKADMKKVIKNKAGRLDEVLSTFLHKEDNSEHKVLTSFPDLDKLMGGFHLGELVVIGARPSHGKTSFMLSLARNISFRKRSTAVLYLNLESTLRQTAERLALMIKEDDKLNEAPFYISAPQNNIEAILKEIQTHIKNKEVKVVFIDYIQVLQISDDNQRNRSLTSALRALKQLAGEKQISIVIASQLNRSIELRSGYQKRPFLSDLRDSGALEQESDKVIFLQRPEIYGITEDEDGNSTRGAAEIILAKNRSGLMGEMLFRFKQETVSFECFPEIDYNWGKLNADTIF